jgi:regulator of sigma E protease
MLLTIASFLFVLGIVVFVHELGHFSVAKMNGVYVLTFSFGFGPKLLRKRIGETEYAISIFPFGGYVKFAGESGDEESDEELRDSRGEIIPKERYYRYKSPQRKIAIILAGPFMNALLAIVVYIMSYWVQGVYVNPNTVISAVEESSPAAVAGFLAGDRIIAVNGEELKYWDDIEQIASYERGVLSTFTLLRDGDTLSIAIAPAPDPETGYVRFGLMQSLLPKIGFVKKDSPAYEAGIRPGAYILSIDDTVMTSYEDIVLKVRRSLGVPLAFKWELDGQTHTAVITPESGEAAAGGERLDVIEIGTIGIFAYYERVRISFTASVVAGTRDFVYLFRSIIEFLGKLFTGKASVKAVGGPIRVGVMAGDMARWGFGFLIKFIAFFSLNLAIFNLLPLLPFDGGHFVLYFAELVTGRRMNQRIQQVMMQVGFIIFIILVAMIFALDVFNLFR